MKLLQVLLFAIAAFTGCAKKADTGKAFVPVTIKNDTTTTAMTDTLHYLALGDSYTIGEAVSQDQSYPYQLIDLLNFYKLNVQNPDIIAITGWTTDNLIDAISKSSFKNKKYDFVTLLIGVNDQYQRLDQGNYRTKFAQVLQTAIAFAGGDNTRVFVLSIPDWGVTPFAGGQDAIIGPVIDQFNAINKDETAKAHVTYFDITPISRQAASDATLVAPDGLHPSGKMYQQWVQLIEPGIKARLLKK
jgi:lysophospholipase L1-like esterase